MTKVTISILRLTAYNSYCTTMRLLPLMSLFLLCGSSTSAFLLLHSISNSRVSTIPLFAEWNRRSWLQLTTAGWATNLLFSPPRIASAAPDIVPMKTFIDPLGLFVIIVPQRFFSLRRSAKGDLPDTKTGQGRRGSSIFTSGDMAKAEVVAIERYASI